MAITRLDYASNGTQTIKLCEIISSFAQAVLRRDHTWKCILECKLNNCIYTYRYYFKLYITQSIFLIYQWNLRKYFIIIIRRILYNIIILRFIRCDFSIVAYQNLTYYYKFTNWIINFNQLNRQTLRMQRTAWCI